ncbi:MAG: hypothetical protein ACQEVA_12180 [Myxococcota bacterium]
MSIQLDVDFQFAGEEFLLDGERQEFPLEGEYNASGLALTTRYGFTDKFEMGGRLRLKHVTFEADPVVLLAENPNTPDQEVSLETARERTLDFSTNNTGAGDVDLFARYNFFNTGVVLLTTETLLKLPTGYETPSGTFENDDFAEATIQDDVTLGDGQTDLRQSLLFGGYIPASKTFVRADLGYKLRFGVPGDQGLASAKVGQLIGESFVVFVGARGALTLFDGESIGKTFIAADPSVSAQDFTVDNIEIKDLTLDRDYIQVEAGAIVKVADVELQFAYSRIVAGRNIPLINLLSFGTVMSAENVSGEADAAE